MIRSACFFLSVAMLQCGPIVGGEVQKQSKQTGSHGSTETKCQATGKTEIRIDCAYEAAPVTTKASEEQKGPRILLDHALITFEPAHESRMRIELTFTNAGKIAPVEARTVYIEFDDEAGENHIRRPLPHVNLKTLTPDTPTTSVDQFLAPALQPGRYFVRLWIPSLDPKLKFDAAHNLLLGNEEVADPANGLNRIAVISIEAGGGSRGSDDH